MRRAFIGIFLVSVATLMLEIAFMRMLSISHFYHFAFLVISVAMFGFAAAGTYLHVKRLKRPLYVSSLLFSVSALLSFYLINILPFDPAKASVNYLYVAIMILYYLVLALPFFFAGLIIAYSFVRLKKDAGRLYFYNLAGSALGSLLILMLFSMLGEKVIFVIFGIALASSIFFAKESRRAVYVLAAAAVMFGVLVPFELNVSDYKEYTLALNYPGSSVLDSRWNSFSRVDVIDSSFTRYAPGLSLGSKRLPEQVGILTDGGNMNAITSHEDAAFVDSLPTSIGYQLIDEPKALILNAGGGLDVLAALKNNASTTAVESNPIVIDLLRADYAEFSGDIYRRADVHVGDGRSFIKRSGNYDIIVLSLAGNVLTSGLYGINENYLLTVEAIREYHDHLSEDGILIITRWLYYPPRESLKLFSMALEIDPSADSIALFRSGTTVTLLLSKNGLNEDRIEGIKGFTEANKFDIIYLPAEFEPNKHAVFQKPYYHEAIMRLLDDRERFEKDYIFDISPVHDNKPFYFNFLKFSKIDDMRDLLGESWLPFTDPGFLLIFLLVQAVILSAVFILLPLRTAVLSKSLAFFLCIGLAYFFVQIVLIQKFILFLGQAAYSMATVIFSMLLFSSIGSLYSGRIRKSRLPLLLIVIGLMTVLYAILVPVLIGLLQGTIMLKFLFTAAIIAPLAFLMGMPFPMGIRIIDKDIVPWAWAVNGSASVLSTILAVIVSLSVGYAAVLIAAGIIYALGAVFIRD